MTHRAPRRGMFSGDDEEARWSNPISWPGVNRSGAADIQFPTIVKSNVEQMPVKPNLDYEKTVAGFRWEEVYQELDWMPDGSLNAAHEAIDRHALGPLGDKTAMIWLGKEGEREEYTFRLMRALSSRFANVLKSLGVEKGDRICICLDRVPELYAAFFGTLKSGAIAVPLASDSSPEAIKACMMHTKAKVLVTQPNVRRSIYATIFELFDLQHIIVVNKNDRDPLPMETADLDYVEEMGKAPADFPVAATGQYDGSVLHYTRGTAGEPTGVVHAHLAVAQHYATGRWLLDLRDGDVFWSLADPATVIGTSYGILAPWTNGATQLVYESDMDAGSCYEAIQRHKVSVWHATPAAIAMLVGAGDGPTAEHDLSGLRHVVSTGGSIPPDAVAWTANVLRMPVHDSWLQAETGTALVANYRSLDIRPGSAGKAVPGVEAAVLDPEYNRAPADTEGLLAVRPGWPSMFRAYWNDPELYGSRFRRGWYATGDIARMDSDGYVWLADRPETGGRAKD